MWRKLGDDEQIVELAPGVSLTIPTGTYFQFRCDGDESLDVIGATMPPWPGEGEAFFVDGTWHPHCNRAGEARLFNPTPLEARDKREPACHGAFSKHPRSRAQYRHNARDCRGVYGAGHSCSRSRSHHAAAQYRPGP